MALVMPYYYEGQKKKSLMLYDTTALMLYDTTRTNAILPEGQKNKKLCGSSPILISLVNFMSIAGI